MVLNMLRNLSPTIIWCRHCQGTIFIHPTVGSYQVVLSRKRHGARVCGTLVKPHRLDVHPIRLVAHPTDRKWVITMVINGIGGVSPLITGVITHLLSGMNHQVCLRRPGRYKALPGTQPELRLDISSLSGKIVNRRQPLVGLRGFEDFRTAKYRALRPMEFDGHNCVKLPGGYRLLICSTKVELYQQILGRVTVAESSCSSSWQVLGFL